EALAAARGGAPRQPHPAAPGEPPMGDDTRHIQGPLLLVGPEADPEVGVLGPKGKTREEPRPDEIAPAAEHRGDPDARPAPEHLVEIGGRAGDASILAP